MMSKRTEYFKSKAIRLALMVTAVCCIWALGGTVYAGINPDGSAPEVVQPEQAIVDQLSELDSDEEITITSANDDYVVCKPGKTYDIGTYNKATWLIIRRNGTYTFVGESNKVLLQVWSGYCRNVKVIFGTYDGDNSTPCKIEASNKSPGAFAGARSPIEIAGDDPESTVTLSSAPGCYNHFSAYWGVPCIRKDGKGTKLIFDTEDPTYPGSIDAEAYADAKRTSAIGCYSNMVIHNVFGNVVFKGGIVTAYGSRNNGSPLVSLGGGGPGIGADVGGDVDGITFEGTCDVTATAGNDTAAAIGTSNGELGDIGYGSDDVIVEYVCKNITMTGGYVEATVNYFGGACGGAGIGGGAYGSLNGFTMTGGEVHAKGANGAAGIGGGADGNGTGIVITGGTVRASGGASGIGGGEADGCRTGAEDADANWYGDCEVTIDQADPAVPTDVEVDGGLLSDWSRTDGVGIGCWTGKYHYFSSKEVKGKKRSVKIRGGRVKASGNGECPGIGAGTSGYIGTIEISGGDIEAVNAKEGPSIGGGRLHDTTTYNKNISSCGTIRISGGTIMTKGGDNPKGKIGGIDYTNSDYSKNNPAKVYITGGNICADMFRTTPYVSENGPEVVCNPIVFETFSMSSKTREKHAVRLFLGALSDGTIVDDDYGLHDVHTFPAEHSYDPLLYFWLPKGHTVRAAETEDTLLDKGLDLQPADIRYFSGMNVPIEQESKGYATIYPPFYFLFDDNYDVKDLNAGNAPYRIGEAKAISIVNETKGSGDNTFTPKYYSLDKEGKYPLLESDGSFIEDVTDDHTIWTDTYRRMQMINKPGESPSYSRDDQGKWRYGVQLYAIWGEYELSYDGNKPQGASTQISGSMDSSVHEYDAGITIPDCGYTLPGYEFRGWSVKPVPETGDRIYRPGDEVAGTDLSAERGGSVTLYAQWGPRKYEIIFDSGDANEGSRSQFATFDEPGTLALNQWKYEHYAFHGWTTEAFGSFYEDGAEFCNLCTLNSDGTIAGKQLTAQWVGKGKIAIAVTLDGRPVKGLEKKIFFTSGGTDFRVSLEYTEGSYVYDPSAVPDPGALPGGYFTVVIGDYQDYWELPEGKGSFLYGADEKVSVVLEYDTVQVAKENDNVTDVFVAESETAEQQTQMVVPDHKKLFLSASVKDRYHFTGYTVAPMVLPDYTVAGVAPVWSEDPTVSKQTIMVTGPVRLIAHGEPNTYTVQYDANGGSGSMSGQAMTYDQAARLSVNTFDRQGYVFLGWNTKPDGTGIGFDDHAWINEDNQNDLAPEKNNGKVTLYALWEPITYGISYDLDGGKLPDGKDNPATYTAETNDITLVNPKKKDYDFAGWTGTGLQKPTKKVIIKKGSTGDRTYKANWKLKDYKVTFVTNGGSKVKTQTVKIHQKAKKPSNPKKKGYTFKGWYANKALTKAFNFNTAIEKNTTVYAKWAAKSIPVLLAQGEPSGKTNVRISWNKVPGTAKYLVYAARCGNDVQRITVTSRTSFNVKKVIGKKGQWKKLKSHRAYKFVVVAADKNGNVLAISKPFHVITTNTMNKYANIKTIKANKKKVTLKKGKTLKLGAKYTLPKGKKHINKGHGQYLRFTSDNPQVISVDSKGTIKARDTGKATIYIQDTCGKYCKTVVTVK